MTRDLCRHTETRQNTTLALYVYHSDDARPCENLSSRLCKHTRTSYCADENYERECCRVRNEEIGQTAKSTMR